MIMASLYTDEHVGWNVFLILILGEHGLSDSALVRGEKNGWITLATCRIQVPGVFSLPHCLFEEEKTLQVFEPPHIHPHPDPPKMIPLVENFHGVAVHSSSGSFRDAAPPRRSDGVPFPVPSGLGRWFHRVNYIEAILIYDLKWLIIANL